jgi:hypothetical protein
MTAAEVYAMQPEYQQYKEKNFAANLKRLRESIAKHRSRADADAAALTRDLSASSTSGQQLERRLSMIDDRMGPKLSSNSSSILMKGSTWK